MIAHLTGHVFADHHAVTVHPLHETLAFDIVFTSWHVIPMTVCYPEDRLCALACQ